MSIAWHVCAGLVMLLHVMCVGYELKCVCVVSLYADGSNLRIPTQLQPVTDWLMHRLHRGQPSGWICVHQRCLLGGCANICANISTVRYKIKIRSRIFRTYSCVWYTQYWSVWEGSPRLWFSQCHNKTNTTDSTDSECDIHWCWKWTLRVVQIGLQSFNVAMGS